MSDLCAGGVVGECRSEVDSMMIFGVDGDYIAI